MKTISDFQYEIEQTRSHIADEYATLSDALNFKKRLSTSVQQHPFSWIGSIFFIGTTLPWFFKKSTPPAATEFSSTDIQLDKKKKSSALSKSVLVATSLLQDKKMRSGLFSAACFVLPLLQEAMTNYVSRRKNKKFSNESFSNESILK